MGGDSKPSSADTQPGQPYRLHRWELPDSHPQRFVGSVHDDLVLDEAGRVAPRVDAGQELIAPGAAPLRNLRNTCPQQVSPSQIAQLFNGMAS